MSCEDLGVADVYEERVQRARKKHRCCACREHIVPGERYQVTFVVDSEGAGTYKHCLRCAEMLDILVRMHRERDTGEMPELMLMCGHDWEEVFGEAPPEAVQRLAFMTKEEMQAELGR